MHADPHSANVVILPGGTLGLVDLGNVGTLDERNWRKQVAVFRGIARRSIHDTYAALLSMVEPLPVTNISRLERECKNTIANWLIANSSPHTPPLLKSNGRLRFACVNEFRRAGLQVPWILMTVMRSIVISDMLIYGLDPEVDTTEELAGVLRSPKPTHPRGRTRGYRPCRSIGHCRVRRLVLRRNADDAVELDSVRITRVWPALRPQSFEHHRFSRTPVGVSDYRWLGGSRGKLGAQSRPKLASDRRVQRSAAPVAGVLELVDARRGGRLCRPAHQPAKAAAGSGPKDGMNCEG